MYKEFEGIKLDIPLFYNNKFGLRFQIGLPDLEIWTNYESGIYNEIYFDTALNRAVDIFEQVFAADDDISIVYQVHLNRRNQIRKSNFIFKQISEIEKRYIDITKCRILDNERFDCISYRYNKVVISNIKTEDVNVQNILLALINSDFRRAKPVFKGNCFFINHTRDVVLNLYDDRGMDIVALERSALETLYKGHSEFLLDYDREYIDDMFSSK